MWMRDGCVSLADLGLEGRGNAWQDFPEILVTDFAPSVMEKHKIPYAGSESRSEQRTMGLFVRGHKNSQN